MTTAQTIHDELNGYMPPSGGALVRELQLLDPDAVMTLDGGRVCITCADGSRCLVEAWEDGSVKIVVFTN